jgi:hypothetical protein
VTDLFALYDTLFTEIVKITAAKVSSTADQCQNKCSTQKRGTSQQQRQLAEPSRQLYSQLTNRRLSIVYYLLTSVIIYNQYGVRFQ